LQGVLFIYLVYRQFICACFRPETKYKSSERTITALWKCVCTEG